jgi:hypothetical protein
MMIPRLAALVQRRAHLIADIDRERASLHITYAIIRQDLVYVGFGLIAGRLLARHTWLRIATLAVLAIVAGSRRADKSKTTKNNQL